jgi:hypothetical protein
MVRQLPLLKILFVHELIFVIIWESNDMSVTSDCETLLYCSSVSPQPLADGRLLIYRHLARQQTHNLLLVVPANNPPGNELRVMGSSLVPPAPIWFWRLRRGLLFPLGDKLIANQVVKQCEYVSRHHKPNVVVTVFMPDGFMTAAADFARNHGLPLVLLCHDDYEDNIPPSFHAKLAIVYRQAAVRLCVSQPMEEEFHKRYGVNGTVLLPIPSAPAQLPLTQAANAPLRIGFAGSIGAGYENAILQLADHLLVVGGQLIIVSPSSRKMFLRIWAHPAILDLGQVAPEKVRETFHLAGVNVLGVVQSFDPDDERAFRLNFPSKLTEYCTFGLPLLIVAPKSASAYVWASSKGRVAALACDLSDGIKTAIAQLNNSEERQKLAIDFFETATEFDPVNAQAIFDEAIN